MSEPTKSVRLTAVQFDTLVWMVAFEKKHRRCPTQRDLRDHFGLGASAASSRCHHLADAGCLEIQSAGRAGYTKILPLAREVVAAGRDAAIAVQLPTVERLRDLPEVVYLDVRSLAVLRVVHKRHLAGSETSTREAATAVGRPWGGVRASMDTLVKSELLTAGTREGGVRRALTPLGLAVAEGRVRVEPITRTGRPRSRRAPEKRSKGPGVTRIRAAVERRTQAVAAPLPPPPPLPTQVREASPAPAPEEKDAPESAPAPLSGYRGIKHPALPSFAAARPASRSLVGWS